MPTLCCRDTGTDTGTVLCSHVAWGSSKKLDSEGGAQPEVKGHIIHAIHCHVMQTFFASVAVDIKQPPDLADHHKMLKLLIRAEK
jgi:hypothetical protein